MSNFEEIGNFKNFSNRLENHFLRELKKYPQYISYASQYLSKAGGKRLRPLMLLLVSESLNYRKKDRFEMATVVETIHMASLIHDDVIDDANLRRGQATLHKKFGNHFSILIGDYLYAKAISKTLSQKNLKLMNLLSFATIKMIEGEIWAQQNLRNPNLSIKEYLNQIKNKTGYLFAASSSIPAILAGREELFKDLYNFGLNFGIFFQILDDTLDFIAKEEDAGKPVLHDLEEGKINLPVLLLFKYLAEGEKKNLKDWIKNSSTFKKEIQKKVLEHNTHKESFNFAKKYSKRCINFSKNLPEGKAKEILLKIPEKLISLKVFENL